VPGLEFTRSFKSLPGKRILHENIPWEIDTPGVYRFVANISQGGFSDQAEIPFEVQESQRVIFAPEYPWPILMGVLLLVPFTAFWLARKKELTA
jgi:hypothetical protein